jgi:hypothetical protein
MRVGLKLLRIRQVRSTILIHGIPAFFGASDMSFESSLDPPKQADKVYQQVTFSPAIVDEAHFPAGRHWLVIAAEFEMCE